jgi:AraC family L-rhamnose operon regulatory protein RhaS
LQPHRNEGIEVSFLESGSMGFAVDDHGYVLQPDDLTVTRPWQLHRVGDPNIGPGRLHWLILDVGVRRPNQAWKWPSWLILSPAESEELTNILRHNEQPVWRASTEIRRCFQSIAQAVERDRDGSNSTRLTIRINDLFLLLLELLRSQKIRLDQSLSGSRRTVQLFVADLSAHPEHLALEWTVEDMASSCGLGVTQFVYHVKRLTNLPPIHYLNHCRLDLAATLLRASPGKTVTDIAFACGFSSGQYFATLFSQRFGLSPREFRQQSEIRHQSVEDVRADRMVRKSPVLTIDGDFSRLWRTKTPSVA